MATEKCLKDANALIAEFEWLQSQVSSTTALEIQEHIQRIKDAPTADAVEVVRGEWTIIEDDYCGLIGLECSHCKKTWWFDEESPIGEYHFCPGCGADMRERKDNE